jgi:prevent-host-death family protein
MTLVTITEAKANLSELITMVERGGEVVITRWGKPVATLTKFQPPKKPNPVSSTG